MNPSMSAELLRHRNAYLQDRSARDRRWYATPRRRRRLPALLRRRKDSRAAAPDLVPCCS